MIGLGVALHCLYGRQRKEPSRRTGLFISTDADKGNARKFAFQILGVACAVGGMVQQRVDIMKNVLPGYAVVVIESLE